MIFICSSYQKETFSISKISNHYSIKSMISFWLSVRIPMLFNTGVWTNLNLIWIKDSSFKNSSSVTELNIRGSEGTRFKSLFQEYILQKFPYAFSCLFGFFFFFFCNWEKQEQQEWNALQSKLTWPNFKLYTNSNVD